MSRLPLVALLASLLPAYAFAQPPAATATSTTAPAAASADAPRKHSAFGELMGELTRAARQQAQAAQASTATVTNPPAAHAAPTQAAPALAASNDGG